MGQMAEESAASSPGAAEAVTQHLRQARVTRVRAASLRLSLIDERPRSGLNQNSATVAGRNGTQGQLCAVESQFQNGNRWYTPVAKELVGGGLLRIRAVRVYGRFGGDSGWR